MAQKRNCMLTVGAIAIVLLLLFCAQGSPREGFQSVVSCVDQGYPQEFCMRVPAQAVIDSGYCNCANGELGTSREPGMCTCFPFNAAFPYYPSPVFRDWLR